MLRPNIEPFYRDLGAEIAQRRRQLGMTQEQLGLRLAPPMTRSALTNIESGRQRILAHTLVQIARELHINLDRLIPTTHFSGVQDSKQLATARQIESIQRRVEKRRAGQ